FMILRPPISTLFPYTTLFRSLMLVMVVFFIAFRWIHLSTPLIRLFLLVLILLLMPTLNFLPVWFALSLLRFRLPSRLPMMFILRSEERFSRNAETDLVCRLLLEKKKKSNSFDRFILSHGFTDLFAITP